MTEPALFTWPSPPGPGDRVALLGSDAVQIVVAGGEELTQLRAAHDASEQLVVPSAWLRPVLAS